MKTHHLFGLYWTLLVPVGLVAGLSLARLIGHPETFVVAGGALGLACSYLLLRRTAPDDTP